jgi:hypothetical protein
MQPRFVLLAVATFLTAGTAFADNMADHMAFQSPSSQSNAWQGYWTSPYLVTDLSSGESLTVYCLDFNHEVAPPIYWDAYIRPLNEVNLSFFLYGSLSDAFQRYEAAGWLFEAIRTLPLTANQETEYQAAAWKLFVDGSHEPVLTPKIHDTGSQFETDVTSLYNKALTEGPKTLEQTEWFVVTVDPDWEALNQPGVPVQEFLIYRGASSVPEPAAIVLLATVAGLLGLRMRSSRRSQLR